MKSTIKKIFTKNKIYIFLIVNKYLNTKIQHLFILYISSILLIKKQNKIIQQILLQPGQITLPYKLYLKWIFCALDFKKRAQITLGGQYSLKGILSYMFYPIFVC